MSDIKELYNKFLEKRCSREEAEELLRYFRDKEHSEEILSLIESELQNPLSDMFVHPEDDDIIQSNWDKLNQAITPPKKIHPLALWRKYKLLAAALFVILGVGTLWYKYSGRPADGPVQLISQYGDDVLPAANSATITLADGRIITLTDQHEGIMIDDEGIKYDDGTMVASDTDVSQAVIRTPRGGQYRITLPDGTTVILNAATSLSYPSRFVEGERVVTLEGEAYFDVVHDAARPFRVHSHDQEIEVLGTRFNASSYDLSKTVTTLIEGRVKLHANNRKEVILTPGQQAVLDKQEYHVQHVATEDYTSWIDNQFVFSDMRLDEVFTVLERWYDVTFDYPAELVDQRIYAAITRDRKLSEVLKTLEEVVPLQFKITGRRVDVRK